MSPQPPATASDAGNGDPAGDPAAGAAAPEHRRGPAGAAELVATLEMMGDGFLAFDDELNYTYVNTRAAELLGRRDLVGRSYLVEFPEAVGSPFEESYRRVLTTREPARFESFYEPWDRWFENRVF